MNAVTCFNKSSSECNSGLVNGICGQNGSGSCQIVCADRCIGVDGMINAGLCANNTITYPHLHTEYSLECYLNKSYYTDYKCNRTGHATQCAYCCDYNVTGSVCKSVDESQKNIMCEMHILIVQFVCFYIFCYFIYQ